MTSTEPRTDIFEHRPEEPISDQLLLQAARDGSTGAFGVLYARHREHAVAIARRTLGATDAGLAEDVAEAAFIDVFNALRNGGGPTDTLRHYLTTAVRREAWRTQHRQRRQLDTADRVGSEPSSLAAAEAGTDASIDANVLLTEAFRGLSERWRHVLWLTEVEGRRPAEIAPLLGVSAGTASALAYRARQGLIAAYLAAYRSRRTDPSCRALSARLGEFVAAGPDALGFDDVRAHLASCSSCRDLARGVDVGAVLGVAAPFGLLTAGWWAKGIAAGGAKVALAAASGATAVGGAATAASTGGAAGGAGASAGAGAGSGGLGVVGAVAAAVAAAVVVAGAALGFGGSDEVAAPPSTSAATAVEGAALERPSDPAAPGLRPSPVPSVPAPSSADPTAPAGTAPVAPLAPAVPTTATTIAPRPPSTTLPVRSTPTSATTTTLPATTTTLATTTSLATTTTTLATTTSLATTTTTTTTTTSTTTPSSTTTTVVEPGGRGVLVGGVVLHEPSGATSPVAGVRVLATDLLRQVEGVSGADGRWRLEALEPGTYLVLAEVPAAYRPVEGIDPWLGGPTWTAVLGLVQVGEGPIDLADLHVVAR